jgi:hypothetical protein
MRLHVRFIPDRDIHLHAWIGAVLRNNFLVNTAEFITDDGHSLYEHIEELTISPDNPYYNQLVGGFPKGIWLDCRNMAHVGSMLRGGELYSFSIVMMGWYARYAGMAVQAVDRMLSNGIGHPKVKSHIVDIVGDNNEGSITNYSDLLVNPDAPKMMTLKIVYETPLSLIRKRSKKDSSVSYQDKLNGFPSFYQFMRSVISRVNTLGMLYGDGPIEDVDAFLADTSQVYMLGANIKYRRVHSTPKQGRSSVYVMDGYEGSTTWANVPTFYLPILHFAEALNVGYNIPFGLGAFSIEIL